MDDHLREKHVLSQLVEAQNAIRQKYNLLKSNRTDTDKFLNETFKPIVDPLKTIAKTVEPLKNLEKKKATTESFKTDEKIKLENSFTKKPKFIKKPRPSYNAASDSSDKYSTQSSGEDTDNTVIHNDTLINDSLSEESENEMVPADEYISALDKNDTNYLDLIYGVRKESNGTYTLGKFPVTFGKNEIEINRFRYPKTDGLMELLVAKHPNTTIITPNDKKNYKEILEISSAHRKGTKPNEPIRTHNSNKFNNIISQLFSATKNDDMKTLTVGTSLPSYKVARNIISTDYVYWDDPNELVDRLQLLEAERSAGNNSHINEIHSIIEELREAGYIY